MRVTKTVDDFKVLAISGTYVVTLGYHLPENLCNGLLGFSIHRKSDQDNKAFYLEGMKCFAETDPGFPAGSLYPTDKQPIQGFQWADYSAEPGVTYTYTVAALKGSPANLTEFRSVSIEITTEKPDSVHHDVYFNRGTAASQEYQRRFGDKKPKDVIPKEAAFAWLSRGLYEAMTKFVNDTVAGVHSLRIAAYEFNYEPFLEILKEVSDKLGDVQIVYDARKADPRDKNEAAISNTGIGSICTPRKQGVSYISHNKFIVKLENGTPVEVWTGGTNFSEGGIFGHSNVAHVVKDADIAKKYLDYWDTLHADLKMGPMKKKVEELTGIPSNPPIEGTSLVFSPRTNLDALNYYADLATQASGGLFMTFAFGMNKVFKDVYRNSQAPFRLALLERKTRSYKKAQAAEQAADEQEIQDLRNMPENVFAIGNFIRTNKFDGWVEEHLSDLNPMVKYIHNKFMLIDPFSDDPTVIAGSANFSDASTTNNDENMVVVKGNKRVADIYLGEFMRLFSHYSFRESLNWRSLNTPPKPLQTGAWWRDNFGQTPRSSRRRYFAQVTE